MGQGCLCCKKGCPFRRPRICPVCDHVFQGNGWDGIDAHWRASHLDVMPYEQFWGSLCGEHGGAGNSPTTREQYSLYVKERNVEGSNKASSYIRALDLLNGILKNSSEFRADNFWSMASVDEVEHLYEYALQFQKQEGSIFLQDDRPPSYGRNGWYSAALKSYQQFLVVNQYEAQLWDIYHNPKIAPEELAKRLANQNVESAEMLIDDKDIDFKSREGREAVSEVKARIGQEFFRKMILSQYSTQCCITGLNVPAVLRASHITSWVDDKENRLNPANGLCLSATYDAAFDRYLISFDEDYRMIFSPQLKEYYSNEAFKTQFLTFEGLRLSLPQRFCPDQAFLEKHRAKLKAA